MNTFVRQSLSKLKLLSGLDGVREATTHKKQKIFVYIRQDNQPENFKTLQQE